MGASTRQASQISRESPLWSHVPVCPLTLGPLWSHLTPPAVQNEMQGASSEEIQAFGLHCMGSISANCSCQELKDGITKAASSMNESPSSCIVQVEGACTLLTIMNAAFTNPAAGGEIVIYMWQESILRTVMRALSLFCVARSKKAQAYTEEIPRGQLACYHLVTAMYSSRVEESKTAPEEALRAIPLSIQTHIHNAELNRQAFWSMAHATNAAKNIANVEFLEKDGITAIMQGMQAHEDHIDLLQVGCAALASMCIDRMPTKYLMLDRRAPQLVIRLLKKHMASPSFSTLSCKFLASLMIQRKDMSIHESVSNLGAAEVVPSALERHKNVASVQREASAAILHMHLVENNQYIKRWLADGLYQNVLHGMKNFPHERSIQLSGCIILHTLLCVSDGDSEPVVQELGIVCIPVMLHAMTAHFSVDTVLVKYACECLGLIIAFNMYHNVELIRGKLAQYDMWAAKSDGINTLARILRAHPDNEKIQHSIIAIIFLLAASFPKYQDDCRNSGAITAIIRATKRHKDSELVLIKAREALNAITRNHEENTEYVKREMSGKQAARMEKFTLEKKFGEKLENAGHLPEQDRISLLQVQEWVRELRMEHDITGEVAQSRQRDKLGQRCAGCGRTAGEMGVQQLLKCSVCTIAPMYCGTECQKAQWKTHKAECKANRKPV